MSDDYERVSPEFVRTLFDMRCRAGTVWIADDGASVAMWNAPGVGHEHGPGEDPWARLRAQVGEEAYARLAAYNDAVTAAAPSEPHWYLGVLATLPGRQGEGLATAVMGPAVEEADRAGLACFLETSTAVNRRFYERRGFVAVGEIALPPGAPRTWWMRRAEAPVDLAA